MGKYLMQLFVLVFLMTSCKNGRELDVVEVEGEQIEILQTIPPDSSIAAFIAPYKEHVDQQMNLVLAYSPYDLKKTDGDLNTAIGNMMADAVMEFSNPIFQKRTGEEIDVVLLNFGGIRSSINRGDITTRTAFGVMPFENEVVVAALNAEQIREMVRYLIDDGVAHPFAGLELVLNSNNAVEKILIQGEPIEDGKTYFVATNDYLFQGGDNMIFFQGAEATNLDYKIRNLLIDYFKKYDTIAPVRDERFIRQ